MASFLTVKVHPVVYMTMVDSYERRSQKVGMNDKALGTLLGFYEKNIVQVTNCFAIPFRETQGLPEINDAFNQEMLLMNKRSTPSEQVVGWFFTVSDLTESCEMYHDYYSKLVNDLSMRKEQPPIILLTMDVSFNGEDSTRFPVRAYVRAEAGIPNKSQNHAVIFQPLKVEMDAFLGESVALATVQKGTENKARTAELDVGIEHLEKSTEEMIQWLERLQSYVNDVLKQKEMPVDSSMGRRLMDIVNTANTQLPADKLERLVKNSLRDYMMISYLANLTKTQLALQERMLMH